MPLPWQKSVRVPTGEARSNATGHQKHQCRRSNNGPCQGTTRPLHFPGQPSLVSSRTVIWHDTGKLNTGPKSWGCPRLCPNPLCQKFGFSKKKHEKTPSHPGVPPPQCRPKVHHPSVWANTPGCRAACHLAGFWGWKSMNKPFFKPIWLVV